MGMLLCNLGAIDPKKRGRKYSCMNEHKASNNQSSTAGGSRRLSTGCRAIGNQLRQIDDDLLLYLRAKIISIRYLSPQAEETSSLLQEISISCKLRSVKRSYYHQGERDMDSTEKPAKTPFHMLSFGGGVNTVALMVVLVREQAPLDGAIFADTGGETPETYRSVEAAKGYLADHGVPLYTVQARPRQTNLYETALRRRVIPSVQWRWCTRDFKVNPIHKFYSSLGAHINQYMGIAFDEIHRMKDSREDNITNLYP